MAKVIEIENCGHCKFLKRISTKDWAFMPHCGHPAKKNKPIYKTPTEACNQWLTIPDWCPLPDAGAKESEAGDD